MAWRWEYQSLGIAECEIMSARIEPCPNVNLNETFTDAERPRSRYCFM